MKNAKLLVYSLPLFFLFLPAVYSQNPDNYYNDDRKHYHEWYDDYCDYSVIRDNDFRDLKKIINDRWFESTKLEFAKNAVYDNYFTIDQVRELLGLFTFESTKLELAKLAYSQTINNKKYYQLFDVFWFESSVTELNEYIRNNRF